MNTITIHRHFSGYDIIVNDQPYVVIYFNTIAFDLLLRNIKALKEKLIYNSDIKYVGVSDSEKQIIETYINN